MEGHVDPRPIDRDPGPARIGDLLRDPHETRNVEIKRWLDLSDGRQKAALSRHLMALANSGGGFLLFGLAQSDDGSFAHQGQSCPDPSLYGSDAINAIVHRYATPAFNCRVTWVDCPSGCEGQHAVIVVPAGQGTPVVCTRNGPEPEPDPAQGTVYTRRQGPESAPAIDPVDWERILTRCLEQRTDDLVARFKSVIEVLGPEALVSALPIEGVDLAEWSDGSQERREALQRERGGDDPFRFGWWSFAYAVEPSLEPALTLADLRRIMQASIGRETGWPAWQWPVGTERDPYPHGPGIECWLAGGGLDDAAHSDYWRASPQGALYLQRGYDEDAIAQLSAQHRHIEPGTVLDPATMVWRVGECLLHAQRFASAVDAERVRIVVRWTGLGGRRLASLDPMRPLWADGVARVSTLETAIDTEVNVIGSTLPELTLSLTEFLFEQFGFFELELEAVSRELDEMRRR